MAIARLNLCLVAIISVPVHADDLVALYPSLSAYCGVPVGLLYAVTRTESGRWVNGQVEPWPWTLNVDGEGHYFETREEQYAALMVALQSGQGVDVGPMQLNWRWQFERLDSPWLSTDPVVNVLTGCRLLRELYEHPNSQGSWHWAVGKYHRRSTKAHHVAAANRYADQVFRIWDAWRARS